MWYYDRIKELIMQKKLTVVNLCEKVGITEGGFYASIRNNSMKISTLEKIASSLDVELCEIFTPSKEYIEQNGGQTVKKIRPEEEIIQLKEKINTLNEQLLDAVFMLDGDKMNTFKQKWNKP